MSVARYSEEWLAQRLAAADSARNAVVEQPNPRAHSVPYGLNRRTVAEIRMQRALKELLPESRVEPKPPLEKDIQREIRDALKLHPAVLRAFRVNSGMHITNDGYKQRFIRYHDIPGMSDLWAWLKPPYAPRQAFIEVKRPGQAPTPKQAAFLEAVTALGHVGFVASNAADAFERLTQELAA